MDLLGNSVAWAVPNLINSMQSVNLLVWYVLFWNTVMINSKIFELRSVCRLLSILLKTNTGFYAHIKGYNNGALVWDCGNQSLFVITVERAVSLQTIYFNFRLLQRNIYRRCLDE